MGDSDGAFPLAQTKSTYDANPADPDDVNGTLIYPYMKNQDLFADPMDPAGVNERDTVGTIPSSSVPYRAEQLRFNLALKADFGTNAQFYTPWGYACPAYFTPFATLESMLGDTGNSLYAISSIWDRTSSGGPRGGGNWALDAPCIIDTSGRDIRPFVNTCPGSWWFGGWNPSQPNAWNLYGGAWPWHSSGQVAVVSFADGHVKAMRMGAVAAGCDVRDGWGGRVTDRSKYIWDLE
jgi:prepilin-type processing-associated H-X9-DG protein